MRFLLLGRHRETGQVRLVSALTYATRQEALDGLPSAMAATDGFADHDLFVVDLDVAVPVVFLPAPVPAPVAQATEPEPDEPIADVWEAPASAGPDQLAELSAVEDAALAGAAEVWSASEVADEAVDARVEAPAEEPVEAPLEEPVEEPMAPEGDVPVEPEMAPDLADALRRAASQMESQGIVEPPSVEQFAMPAAVGEAEKTDLFAALEAPEAVLAEDNPRAWPWETSAVVEDEPAVSAEPEPVSFDDAPLEVTPEPADVAEPSHASAPVFEPVGIDQPGLEDITLLTPVSPGGLDVRPVIIGEYTDAASDAGDNPFAVLESMVDDGAAAEPTGGDEPAAVQAEDVASASTVPDQRAEGLTYEPGGTDIAAYTCADCVYVQTCPKANQDGPATCGSFQWTSV